MAGKFICQATRQLAASGGRPVIWIFAEEEAALFARDFLMTRQVSTDYNWICSLDKERTIMAPINYRYSGRGRWAGPADETIAVTGRSFWRRSIH